MKFAQRPLALVVASLAAGAGFLAAATVAAADSGPPYKDPNAVGSIALCDQHDQAVTTGSVDTRPFVWKAVGSTPAAAPYNVDGATAILLAYQPRKGTDPGEWSGEQLSSASRFASATHPTAALTGLDHSLSLFVRNFPPQWDGYIQLRIYLNAPNQPQYAATYDATNIVVKGDTWTVVGGTPAACGAGSATSAERILATSSAVAASLTAQTTEHFSTSTPSPIVGKQSSGAPGAAPTPNGAQGSQPAAASGVPGSPNGSSAVTGNSPTAGDSGAAAGSDGGHGSSSSTLLLSLVVIAVLGGGFIGTQWFRSRS